MIAEFVKNLVIFPRIFTIALGRNNRDISHFYGMALFGPLGDVVKIEWLLIVTGTMLIAGGFILY